MAMLMRKTERTNAADSCRRLMDRAEARRLFRHSVALPDGFKLEDLTIARVFPAKGAAIGIQWQVRLAPLKPGPPVIGNIYATSGVDARGGATSNQLRIDDGVFGLVGLCCPAHDPSTVLHTPDRDDVLTPIAGASGGPRLRERLSRCAPSRISGRTPLSAKCLNYRPRRRCVFRYQYGALATPAFVVGKLYRSGPALRTQKAIRVIRKSLGKRADTRVVIPRILASWRDWNMIIFEGLVPADARTGLITDPAETCRAAGRALAMLHNLSPTDLNKFTPNDEVNATGRWVDLARNLGRLDRRSSSIWTTLRRWASQICASDSAMIHRDFYDSQMLRLESGWGLVDFDTVAQGDPEQDVGNFIGHAIWDVLKRGADDANWTGPVGEFLEMYESSMKDSPGKSTVRSLCPARLQFYLASSLLRVGIIHSMRTGTEQSAMRLHDIAEVLTCTSPSAILARLRDAVGLTKLRSKK